jgi:hypothetical protein
MAAQRGNFLVYQETIQVHYRSLITRTRKVPTVEEIKSLNVQRAAAGAMETPAICAMRARIKELEFQVKKFNEAPDKLTPIEMRQGLDEILRRHGVEPADEAIKILMDPESNLSDKDRAQMWLELMQYRMPKLRSVEHSGRIDSSLTLVVMKFGSNEVLSERPLQIDAQTESIDVEVVKNLVSSDSSERGGGSGG